MNKKELIYKKYFKTQLSILGLLENFSMLKEDY
jgi:hypothetical protein